MNIGIRWHAIAALRRVSAAASVAALCGVSAAYAGNLPDVDAQIAYTYDNNVTRAAQDASIRKDRFATVGIGVSAKQNLGAHQRVIVRAFAQDEAYRTYTGLSNVLGGVSATLQYRPGATLLAPTFSAFGKFSAANFHSQIRDSNFYNVGVSVNKALTDRVAASVVAAINRRDSKSEVFDTRESSFLVNLDYQIAQHATAYLTYNYLHGDIVSSGAPWLAIVDRAKAIIADDAFGGAAGNFFAYRLQANTHVGTVGFNLSVKEHQSFDVSARAVKSDADGNIAYRRTLYSVAYLLKF